MIYHMAYHMTYHVISYNIYHISYHTISYHISHTTSHIVCIQSYPISFIIKLIKTVPQTENTSSIDNIIFIDRISSSKFTTCDAVRSKWTLCTKGMILKSIFGVIKYTDDGRTDRLTDGLKFCRFNFLCDFGHALNFLKPDIGTIKMRPHKDLDEC